MVRNIFYIYVITMFLALMGCGIPYMVQKIHVAHDSVESPVKGELKSSNRIKVEQFSDGRISEVIGGAKNDFGGYSIKYISDADVTKVISDAIKIELSNQGYHVVTENEDFIITGRLLELFADSDPLVVVGQALISVELRDIKEDKIIWRNTINGKSKITFWFLRSTASEKAINLAIKNFIDNFFQSESLHVALM